MKKKLLFVNTDMCAGGIEVSLINLLDNLDYSKYDVDLLLLTSNLDFLNRIPTVVNVICCSQEDQKYHCRNIYRYLKKLYTVKRSIIQKILLRILAPIEAKAYNFYAAKHVPSKYDISIGYRLGMAAEIAMKYVKADKRILFFHEGKFIRIRGDAEQYRLADTIVSVTNGESFEQLATTFPEIKQKCVTMGNLVGGYTCIQKVGA